MLKTNIRMGNIGARKTGDFGFRLAAILRDVFGHAKIQCIAQTGGNTGGLEADFEPVHAHIAFAYLSLDRIQLWRIIGADPGAVATAKADIRIL